MGWSTREIDPPKLRIPSSLYANAVTDNKETETSMNLVKVSQSNLIGQSSKPDTMVLSLAKMIKKIRTRFIGETMMKTYSFRRPKRIQKNPRNSGVHPSG